MESNSSHLIPVRRLIEFEGPRKTLVLQRHICIRGIICSEQTHINGSAM